MAGYTNEYANFPNGYIEKHNFKDIYEADEATLIVIEEIQSATPKEAVEIMKDPLKAELIRQYIAGSKHINTIIEELRNTQIYAKQVQQNIYIGEDPEIPQFGDIVIGD